MNQIIRHSGVVEHIEGGCVHVRIVQTSACAACKVAGYCNAAESKEKIIDVYTDTNAHQFTEGQPVVVTTSTQMATRALLWGFGLPFLLLVVVLFATWLLMAHEGWAALCALASLIPYYIMLWLLRDKMRQELAFSIE